MITNLSVDRGDRVEMPRGPGRVTVRNTAVLRLVRKAAAAPIRFAVLAATVAEAFPRVAPAKIYQTLSGLVAHGVLITSLRAPMTVTDPLGHLIETLDRAAAGTPLAQANAMVAELTDIARTMAEHNAVGAADKGQERLRGAAVGQMRRLSTKGRTTIAGDLHLDCRVTVPVGLAEEMASSVTALVRLTRQPRPDQRWNDWCREFWDRYGTGAVVPVTEATHPRLRHRATRRIPGQHHGGAR